MSSKLTKEGLKGFSISFNKARSLGITDEDLLCIYEMSPNKYRISVRTNEGRKTKVVYDLLDAINKKWEILKASNSNKRESNLSKLNNIDNQYKDITVKDGIELFFKFRYSLVENKVLELTSYEKDIVVFNSRYIQNSSILNCKVTDINQDEAQLFVDYLYSITLVKGHQNEKLSINTIYNPFALIHKVFEYFKNELNIIDNNPFDNVKKKPKYIPHDQNYLTIDEIKLVLSKLEDKNIRFKTMINLILETGLRVEELVAVRYSDFNIRRNTVRISRAIVKSRLNGKLIVKDVKTLDSRREISISSYTMELVNNLRTFKENCGIFVCEDDYLFASWEDNEIISPTRFTAEWREFIRDLGFNELPLRNLRHTAATFMLSGETNIKAVKKRFGWSKTSTVLNIYNQSNLDEDKKLVDKFDEVFRNSLGASYAELYLICANRFNNVRKLKNILQKLFNKPIDKIDLETDLKQCQEYLLELFPIFSKIILIDDKLDDWEIEALFEGFKEEYKKVKIKPI